MFGRIRDLFSIPELPSHDDPVFGNIVNEGGFWLAHCGFPTEPRPVEVIIPADDNGPRPWQQDLFVQVHDCYPRLADQLLLFASKVVAAELPMRPREAFLGKVATNVAILFQLETITLPELEGGSWEACYYCRTTDHNYAVTVTDWIPIDAENFGG